MKNIVGKVNNIWRQLGWRYYWGDPLDVRYFVCDQLSKIKNKKVLDIGCGTGVILSCLDKSNEVLGIDTDAEAILMAKEINPSFSFQKLDWRELEENKKYDVVLFIHLLELTGQAEREAALLKIKKILTDDGLLILTTPNRQNFYYRKNFNKLELNELNELLSHAGFNGKIYGWNPFPIQCGRILKYLPGIFTILKYFSKIGWRKEKSVSFFVEASPSR